ncbi:MAG: excinuclease ABC subunit UvrC [Clostridiaceae bacterium]|nr:excinuclease ABC subunit UvrC [Clostridiaceae bacterium]
MDFEQLKEKAHRLPGLPGVYLMHDQTGEIIYIGKAKSLHNRVSQYFADLSSHTFKTRRMIASIDSFETIFAKTELDALLLESTLIKKHKPKYNILLKDDKGYPFIRLETGAYPRFSVAARRTEEGRYFGPFGGRGTANLAIRLLTETFRLPSCTRKFPRDIGKERPCLRYDLHKCCGICTGEVAEEAYAELMRQCVLVLEGKSEALENELRADMEHSAEALEFEHAAACRDRLAAVQKLGRSRIVVAAAGADVDALAFGIRGTRACVTRLSYLGGALVDKSTAFFDGLDEGDAGDALESYITQYYTRAGKAPRELYLSHPIEDESSVAEFLSSLAGRKCMLRVPQRGEKLRWIELAEQNAALELAEAEDYERRTGKTLSLLQELLDLPAPPRRMEAFDISNTAGDTPVASMTVFEDGRPRRSAYKKFQVKTAVGGDDYGAMAEILGRRLDRAVSGDASFLPLPDLLLMDGGAGQVSVAKQELEKRALDIPLCGMVKDDRHRTRALVTPGGREIGLTAHPAAFALIGRIQEETHRFAVTYHQEKRGKQLRAGVLDGISGLGPARKKLLLRKFGSVKAIAAATEEELVALVPRPVAQAILKKLEPKRGGEA